jgi:hypothetical protein
MSLRTTIVKALTEKFKVISTANGYKTDLYEQAYAKLKFWDEVNNFPCIYAVPGSESREYQPSSFAWAFLGISIKVYVKGDDPQQQLENLLEDIEKVIDANRQLSFPDASPGLTTEVDITSITTDEGLLDPYGVGEINLMVRYPLMK